MLEKKYTHFNAPLIAVIWSHFRFECRNVLVAHVETLVQNSNFDGLFFIQFETMTPREECVAKLEDRWLKIIP